MWTLRRKIMLGYVILIGLAGIVLGAALLNLVRLGGASDDILQENYRSILAAENMLNALARQENAALQMVVGVAPQSVKQFSQSEAQFLLWLERAKANITIESEPKIVKRIETTYQEFLVRLAEFRARFAGDPNAARRYYDAQLAPQAELVRTACADLHDLNRMTMESSSHRAQQIAQAAVWSMFVVGAVVIGAAAVASAWLSNRIVRPVQRLSEATERVASGDYDVAISPESRDEIGELAQKFNVMLVKLRTYHDLNLRRIVGEQKKAEVILQTINDGILVIAADRKVASLNPTAAHVLGIQSRRVEGSDFAEVVEDEQLARAIAAALKSHTPQPFPVGTNMITVESAEGGPSHYEYTLTTVPGQDGGVIGLVVLFRNVTALKELDRLKTEFVMTASHELRSPLTSIAMSIELLREQASDKLDDSGRQMLEVAHEELERLRTLVEELLDLSKIESGKLEITFAEISIPSVLEAAIQPFRALAIEQSIELTLDIPDRLPVLRADATKLTWVVTNLVGNAMRYARERVKVSAELAGRWVNIYVQDDGDGIPYNQQARIFDKFVQVAGDKRPGGAGLGLAISKEIIRAHRGHIWAESEPGAGTLFIVALPVGRTATNGTRQ